MRDEKDERELYRRIADVVEQARARYDVKFCTVTEAKQAYLQESGRETGVVRKTPFSRAQEEDE